MKHLQRTALLAALLFISAGVFAATWVDTEPLPPPGVGTRPIPPPVPEEYRDYEEEAPLPAEEAKPRRGQPREEPKPAAQPKEAPKEPPKAAKEGAKEAPKAAAAEKPAAPKEEAVAEETATKSGKKAKKPLAPATMKDGTVIPERKFFFGMLIGGGVSFHDFNDEYFNQDQIEQQRTSGTGVFGFQMGYYIRRFSINAELLFNYNSYDVYAHPYFLNNGQDTRGTWAGFDQWTFQIPLYFKLDIPLGASKRVVLQPLFGPYFNIPIGGLEEEWDSNNPNWGKDHAFEKYKHPVGLMVGAGIGYKLRKGNMLLFDIRYMTDLGKAKIGQYELETWRWSSVLFTFGYRF
jgi:hypothetical protein